MRGIPTAIGVMVMEADAAYSSQECSRCHQISKPNGKSFRCGYCGHHDHRDANAAFSLSERVMPIGGLATESESRGSKQNPGACPGRIKPSSSASRALSTITSGRKLTYPPSGRVSENHEMQFLTSSSPRRCLVYRTSYDSRFSTVMPLCPCWTKLDPQFC
ncbi:MAG: hypothetical protein DMG30_07515 [Acidobacteria bacterium]|nr:MAG: hypothetical protein DMG30_07515 [Acidobacteriota bacterium]